MTRIEHPSSRSSHLTLLSGLLLAVVLAAGTVWWSRAQDKKAAADRTHPEEFAVPSERDLKLQLSPEQYHVTRENGTETAFHNPYWDNHKPGIYVDLITNEPLFSSLDKFDSGTGWPSFTKPISPEHVVEKIDNSHGMVRTEVRGKKSNSHLGHIFDDGPPPSKLRYCVNSAAMRFVPAEKLKDEGFLEFVPLFQQPASSPAASAPAKLP
jgi:methionine-R-sulfoxide reductase